MLRPSPADCYGSLTPVAAKHPFFEIHRQPRAAPSALTAQPFSVGKKIGTHSDVARDIGEQKWHLPACAKKRTQFIVRIDNAAHTGIQKDRNVCRTCRPPDTVQGISRTAGWQRLVKTG